MIDKMLSVIAPHHCCGCGKVGFSLCDSCKYNIISEHENQCIACLMPCGQLGICNTCRRPYSRAWVVGSRRGTLQRLIGLYKFERLRSAYKVIGDLLDEVIDDLPTDTIVVPIPTVASHVRERGYDHTLLIAKYFAYKHGLKLSRILTRSTQSKQRQASATTREAQAKVAFRVDCIVNSDVSYLLIDDIMTTGSTIKHAARMLKNAGATNVWVAVVARQTLD